MEQEIILYETSSWKVKLSPDQLYLGRCVIVLKRECGEMAKITLDEWKDFQKNVVQKLEKGLRKTFKSTMFNWTCLMNDAFKTENPNPQIHWHFRPRYKNPVKFQGEVFEDFEFAHHYSLEKRKYLSLELLKKIAEKIRSNL